MQRGTRARTTGRRGRRRVPPPRVDLVHSPLQQARLPAARRREPRDAAQAPVHHSRRRLVVGAAGAFEDEVDQVQPQPGPRVALRGQLHEDEADLLAKLPLPPVMMRQGRRNCEVTMLYLQCPDRLDVMCGKRASGERAWRAANSGRWRLSQRRVDSTTCAAAAAPAPAAGAAPLTPPWQRRCGRGRHRLRSGARRPAAKPLGAAPPLRRRGVTASHVGPTAPVAAGSGACAAWPPSGGGDDVHVQEGAVVEPHARVAEGELPRVDPSD